MVINWSLFISSADKTLLTVYLNTFIRTNSQIEFDTDLVPHPRNELGLGHGYTAIYRCSHLLGVAWKPTTPSVWHVDRVTYS